MRSHRDWPLLQTWSRGRHVQQWVKARNLRVARLEPIVLRGAPAAVVDLRFAANDTGIVVPCCIVDQKTLDVRTQDAVIWPYDVAHRVADEELYAIEALLLPWLRAEGAGRGFTSEVIRRFEDGDQAFEAARFAHLLGAVSYASLSEEIAAAHYAARFVAGKHVLTAGSLPNVAALLAPSAARTTICDLGAAELANLETWFGGTFFAPVQDATPAHLVLFAGDLSIAHGRSAADARLIDVSGTMPGAPVTFAPAVAMEELVRIGEAGERAMSVSLIARKHTTYADLPQRPQTGGESEGRFLFVVREDALRAPGADTDEADALRDLLRAEGFTVDVTSRPEYYDPRDYDVVHAFGMLSAPQMLTLMRAAADAEVPTVLTPFFEDIALGGSWGARASRSLLDLAYDEQNSQRVLTLLAGRLVYVDDVNAHERFDGGDETARRALLQQANLVIAHSASECEAIAAYADRTEGIARSYPLAYRSEKPTNISHLVPDQAYMFVHAPVEARHNVGLVLYAASALDIPCVIAGPILDRRLYRHIASRISTNIVLVPESTQAEQAAMLAASAVAIDAAWIGDGTHRILKSILHGSVPVVSERRHVDDEIEAHVVRVDPASFDSIRNGMSEAWQRAGTQSALEAAARIGGAYDPHEVLKATIAAYVAADGVCRQQSVKSR